MSRLILRLGLAARAPLHPGSGRGGDLADLMLRRDAAGRPLIPGTSIAGQLRTLATRLAPGLGMEPCIALAARQRSDDPCECPVCALFGELRPDADSNGSASRLWVSHAELPEGLEPSVRDGVGIERSTRASARGAAAKFDYELVPAGTRFELEIAWDQEGDEKTNADHGALLAACLGQWREGRLWLGGGAGRGLGAVALERIEVFRRSLDDRERLLAFLRGDDSGALIPEPNWLDARMKDARARRAAPKTLQPAALDSFAELDLKLVFDHELLFNDAALAARTGYDHAPLLQLSADGASVLLPGSALRGVLRSQAERIARTLATQASEHLEDFRTHCPACDPNSRSPEAPLAACSALARAATSRGREPTAEADELCLGCRLFGSTLIGSRLRVEGGSCALPAEPPTRARDFVAIDRFTGGAKDQNKFDALVLDHSLVLPARLHLEDPQPWELGWLYLALRDLCEGLVPLGLGGAKGFGRARLQGASLCLARLGDWVKAPRIPGCDYQEGDGLFQTCTLDWSVPKQRERLLAAVDDWLGALRTLCMERDGAERTESRFARGDRFKLQSDSYFGRTATTDPTVDLATLYPKEDAAS